jgi:hypothetical protein
MSDRILGSRVLPCKRLILKGAMVRRSISLSSLGIVFALHALLLWGQYLAAVRFARFMHWLSRSDGGDSI